jgi:hypothetical protein
VLHQCIYRHRGFNAANFRAQQATNSLESQQQQQHSNNNNTTIADREPNLTAADF